MSGEKQALQSVRQRIDDIDRQLQQLLNQRTALAQQVAEIKIAAGEQTDFYRPDREAKVLKQVMDRNDGPLDAAEMARLFREIMSACLAAEKPLQIAYLGPEGSFTQAAALKQFGGSVAQQPMSTIAEVFHEVEMGNANYGVVPVENSTEGMVTHTLDRFVTSPLKINGEVSLRIHHALLSKQTELANINTVYGHPQALAQCRQWLTTHCPDCQQVAMNSNAEAAKKVMSEQNAAAIASDTAAELYELNVLANNIEDETDNTTRFLVIGHQDIAPSGNDKTALLVSTKNQPGALHALLAPLAERGITMSRIESRPSRQGMWEYVFFIDIKGHQQADEIALALQQLEQASAMCRVLGSYPQAVL